MLASGNHIDKQPFSATSDHYLLTDQYPLPDYRYTTLYSANLILGRCNRTSTITVTYPT